MNEEKLEEYPSKERLDPKVSALLSYLLVILSGIIIYATTKNQYVRFHAIQSVLFYLGWIVVIIAINILGLAIPFIYATFLWLVNFGFFALLILLMLKAYQGKTFKLPIIGQLAERLANK
jgi:uncharacterized membrane protein